MLQSVCEITRCLRLYFTQVLYFKNQDMFRTSTVPIHLVASLRLSVPTMLALSQPQVAALLTADHFPNSGSLVGRHNPDGSIHNLCSQWYLSYC